MSGDATPLIPTAGRGLGSRILLWCLSAAMRFSLLFSPRPAALLVRKVFADGGRKMAATVARHAPAGVSSIVDERYGEEADMLLDLYQPASSVEPLPLVLWIHGGGCVGGSKEELSGYLRLVASNGYAVAAPGYSLAPEHRYPTPPRQVMQALAYLWGVRPRARRPREPRGPSLYRDRALGLHGHPRLPTRPPVGLVVDHRDRDVGLPSHASHRRQRRPASGALRAARRPASRRGGRGGDDVLPPTSTCRPSATSTSSTWTARPAVSSSSGCSRSCASVSRRPDARSLRGHDVGFVAVFVVHHDRAVPATKARRRGRRPRDGANRR